MRNLLRGGMCCLKASRFLGCAPHGLRVSGLCRSDACGFDTQGFDTCSFSGRLRDGEASSLGQACNFGHARHFSQARSFSRACFFSQPRSFSRTCCFSQASSVSARRSFRGESRGLYRTSCLFFGEPGGPGALGLFFGLALCRKPSRFFSGRACGLGPHCLFRSQILRGQPLRLSASGFLPREQRGLGARGFNGRGLATGLLARRFFDGNALYLRPRRGFGLAALAPALGVGALVDAQAPPDSQNTQAQRGQKPQR